MTSAVEGCKRASMGKIAEWGRKLKELTAPKVNRARGMSGVLRTVQRYWVCLLIALVWFLIVWKYETSYGIRAGGELNDRSFSGSVRGFRFRNGAEYLGRFLKVSIEMQQITGTARVQHRFVLTNTGGKRVIDDGWSIFFNHLYIVKMLEDETRLLLTKYDGTLRKLSPGKGFPGILPGEKLVLSLESLGHLRRSSFLPRWFAVDAQGRPYMIKSTEDDELGFVGEVTFSSPPTSTFNPEDRYNRYLITDLKKAPLRIVPTPIKSNLSPDRTVELNPDVWVVCSPVFYDEAETLAGLFELKILPVYAKCPPSNFVTFQQNDVNDGHEEGYMIEIFPAGAVKISCITARGAFYAVQTLLSLAESDDGLLQRKLPIGRITDRPRFAYRGLQIDVARNFQTSKDIIEIIKTMSLYKLNKLHLHLTDDDGWRIEIKGLSKLTKIGSIRMHTLDKDVALPPTLGSGPFSNTSGSGFYTVSEYREILKVAQKHHVQVIPEIDIPAHSLAAIVAMRARYKHFMDLGDETKAKEFLLSDFDDVSEAYSPQGFRNSAINPCMSSTYKFVSYVINAMIELHKGLQPLEVLHLGGDEVHRNSWTESPKCKDLYKHMSNAKQLQQYFFGKAVSLCQVMGISSVGVWGDALYSKGSTPMPKTTFGNTEVIAYEWDSSAAQKIDLLKDNYSMVLASSSHFYLDHPSETDPNEFGLEWATSGTDDRKIFEFTLREDLNLKDGNYSPMLDNIVGLEANLWGELTRNTKRMHHQLFPRLLAFAERAWHEPAWEKDASLNAQKKKEWEEFANAVGYKELPRLRRRKIFYRIPPPGVKVQNNELHFATMYPGFSFQCKSSDPESKWKPCDEQQLLSFPKRETEFRTVDGSRTSRVVSNLK